MAVAGPISMVPALGLSSAAGLISMLEETEVQLQTTALRSLNKVIDTHWAEVAGSISVIEAMYEDEFFAQRELAALLASKVRRPPPTPSTRRAPSTAIFQGLPCAHTKPDLKRNLTRPSPPLDRSSTTSASSTMRSTTRSAPVACSTSPSPTISSRPCSVRARPPPPDPTYPLFSP